MKNFIGASTAAALLGLGIAASGLYTVRAEGTAPEHFTGTGRFPENDAASEWDGAVAEGDSAVADGSLEGGGEEADARTHTEADAETYTETDADTVGADGGAEEAGESAEGGAGGSGGGEASLHGLYNDEATAGFIVTVPAEASLSGDAEGNRITGEIPITVKYLRQMDSVSLHIDGGSLFMRDRQSERVLPLEGRIEDGPQEDSGYGGFRCSLRLSGERLAGDWEGTVLLSISAHE